MLLRFDPFDPFRERDRFWQDAFGTWMRPSGMPMDAYRDDDHFVAHFDLPGVDPGSIDLTVENDVLTVSAERRWQPGQSQVLASERLQGTFRRQLFLGEGLDTEHVDASYDSGVLTVTIPIAEDAKPRRIEVTSGERLEAIETVSSAA
jgi:HSP20 family protein